MTSRVLALELFWQAYIIDITFYSNKKVKRKGFFTWPLTFKTVALKKKQTHPLLQDKLSHLRLVMICDKWHYNPFNDLPYDHLKVTHSPRPYWERRHSPLEDKDELLVDPVHIPMEDSKQPWHKFYFLEADYDENYNIGKDLYNKLRNEEEWTNKKIRAFWIYHQETKKLDVPYEGIKEVKEFEWLWDEENPASDSSNSGGDDPDEGEEKVDEEAKTSASFSQQRRKSTGQSANVASNL